MAHLGHCDTKQEQALWIRVPVALHSTALSGAHCQGVHPRVRPQVLKTELVILSSNLSLLGLCSGYILLVWRTCMSSIVALSIEHHNAKCDD